MLSLEARMPGFKRHEKTVRAHRGEICRFGRPAGARYSPLCSDDDNRFGCGLAPVIIDGPNIYVHLRSVGDILRSDGAVRVIVANCPPTQELHAGGHTEGRVHSRIQFLDKSRRETLSRLPWPSGFWFRTLVPTRTGMGPRHSGSAEIQCQAATTDRSMRDSARHRGTAARCVPCYGERRS